MSSSSSISNRSALPQQGLGQVEGQIKAEKAEQSQETQGAKKTSGAKGVDSVSDSFGVSEGSAAADSPELAGTVPPPGSEGPRSDSDTLSGRAGFVNEVSDAALGFAALWEMARSSKNDMKAANELKNAMHQGKIATKQGAVTAEKEKQEGERKAAAENLGAAGAQVAVSIVLGLCKCPAPVATSIGNLTSESVKYYSKVAGGQREADDKALVGKRYEMLEAVFDDAIDTAKNNYEECKEQFKSALRIITEVEERKSQTTQKFTGM